jgi:hypothetical protein
MIIYSIKLNILYKGHLPTSLLHILHILHLIFSSLPSPYISILFIFIIFIIFILYLGCSLLYTLSSICYYLTNLYCVGIPLLLPSSLILGGLPLYKLLIYFVVKYHYYLYYYYIYLYIWLIS